jgi:ABC-type transporter Mla subunit MlaD
MASALNVAMVLRADASGFKGEVSAAGEELRDLGSEARRASNALGAQISAGTARASGALRDFVSSSRAAFTRFGSGIQNAAFQVSDIAVQLEAGVSPLRVMIQQGSQLLAGFGPAGAVAAGVVAGVGMIAASFVQLRDDGTEALRGIDEAMKGLNDTVGEGVASADKLVKAYGGANAEFRQLGVLDYQAKIKDLTKAVNDGESSVGSLVDRLEELASSRLSRVADIRATLGGGVAAGERAQERAALSPEQAAAVLGIAERLKTGELRDSTQLLTELQAALSGAGGAAAELYEKLRKVVTGTAEASAQLRETRKAVEDLSSGAAAELGGGCRPRSSGRSRGLVASRIRPSRCTRTWSASRGCRIWSPRCASG